MPSPPPDSANQSHLSELLRDHKEVLIQKWIERVRQDPSVPEAARLPTPALRDHIPAFIEELAREMDRTTASFTAEERGLAAGSTGPASQHAQERFAERYTTIAALREFSHLRSVITEMCFREAVVLTVDTAQLLHTAIDAAMGRVAAEIEQAVHQALRDEAAVRERFIAILGHDLRTPISSIQMASHALLRQDLTEGQASFVRRISRSAERTTCMIADMLDLAMARLGGGIRVQLRPADTRTVCQRVIDEALLIHPERIIKFAPSGNGRGLFDPDRLAQAVSNLVANALAYSPPASTVRIGTREEGPSLVVIEVGNEGRPIPENDLPTLFDPFRRGKNALARTEGLGLGLFIAKQIALAHGGSLDASSTALEGTLFRLTLPHLRGAEEEEKELRR